MRRRLSLELAQRIEALKFETTIVAEQLVQTSHLQNKRGVFIATLNTCAFASWTPHRKYLVLCALDFVLWTSIWVFVSSPLNQAVLGKILFTIHHLLFTAFCGTRMRVGAEILSKRRRWPLDICWRPTKAFNPNRKHTLGYATLVRLAQ